MEHPGRVFTKMQIYERINGENVLTLKKNYKQNNDNNE